MQSDAADIRAELESMHQSSGPFLGENVQLLKPARLLTDDGLANTCKQFNDPQQQQVIQAIRDQGGDEVCALNAAVVS